MSKLKLSLSNISPPLCTSRNDYSEYVFDTFLLFNLSILLYAKLRV